MGILPTSFLANRTPTLKALEEWCVHLGGKTVLQVGCAARGSQWMGVRLGMPPTLQPQLKDLKATFHYIFCCWVSLICLVYQCLPCFFCFPLGMMQWFSDLISKANSCVLSSGGQENCSLRMLEVSLYILLMVQKSGMHQLRLVVYPVIYRVVFRRPRWLALGFLNHQQQAFAYPGAPCMDQQ